MTEPIAEQQAEIAGSTEHDLPLLLTSVGEQLRAAREKAGLQLVDVAQMLKLGVRQLESLEKGEWDKLPGATFIRGFVRNYARLTGLDPAPLMSQLDSVLTKPASVLSTTPSTPGNITYNASGAREDRRFVLFGLLAALLAALVYFLLPDDLAQLREQTQSMIDSLSRKEEPVAPPVAAPEPAQEPVFPPGTTPQQIMNPQSLTPGDAQGAQTAAVPLAVVDAPPVDAALPVLNFEIVRESWIEVRDRDDKVLFSQRLLAGSQKSLSGNGPLSLAIGFAPGVKLQWRGQAVDLAPHTRGEVARLVLE